MLRTDLAKLEHSAGKTRRTFLMKRKLALISFEVLSTRPHEPGRSKRCFGHFVRTSLRPGPRKFSSDGTPGPSGFVWSQ